MRWKLPPTCEACTETIRMEQIAIMDSTVLRVVCLHEAEYEVQCPQLRAASRC